MISCEYCDSEATKTFTNVRPSGAIETDVCGRADCTEMHVDSIGHPLRVESIYREERIYLPDVRRYLPNGVWA